MVFIIYKVLEMCGNFNAVFVTRKTQSGSRHIVGVHSSARWRYTKEETHYEETWHLLLCFIFKCNMTHYGHTAQIYIRHKYRLDGGGFIISVAVNGQYGLSTWRLIFYNFVTVNMNEFLIEAVWEHSISDPEYYDNYLIMKQSNCICKAHTLYLFIYLWILLYDVFTGIINNVNTM